MAKEVQAVRAYTPRVVQGQVVEMSTLAKIIAGTIADNRDSQKNEKKFEKGIDNLMPL